MEINPRNREYPDVPVKRKRLSALLLDELDPKRTYDIEKLTKDIKENGQKTPVWIKKEDKSWRVFEGIHRCHALKRLGRKTVKCQIVEL